MNLALTTGSKMVLLPRFELEQVLATLTSRNRTALATCKSYIANARKLLGMTDRIYPQFATHNAHSVAAVLNLAGDQPLEAGHQAAEQPSEIAQRAEVEAAQVELAETLFDDHVPAPEIQALITHINNDIHRRIVEAALTQLSPDRLLVMPCGDHPLKPVATAGAKHPELGDGYKSALVTNS